MAQCTKPPFHPIRLCPFSLPWVGLEVQGSTDKFGVCARSALSQIAVIVLRYREVDGIARLNCRIGWSRPKILCSCLLTANTLIDLQHVGWKNNCKGLALHCRKE